MSSLRARQRLIQRPGGVPRLGGGQSAQNIISWVPIWRKYPVFVSDSVADFADQAKKGFVDSSASILRDRHGWALNCSDTDAADKIQFDRNYTLSYPVTFVSYVFFRGSTSFGAIQSFRSGGTQLETLEGSGDTAGQLVDVDFDNTGFDVTGPTIPTNELSVCVVSFTSTQVKRWVSSKSGIATGHRTRTATLTTDSFIEYDIGVGIDGWDGLIYDTLIYDREFFDKDIPSFKKGDLWGHYWRPKPIVPGFVAAEGGRIMSSLTAEGGLAGMGGIAGAGGGLAG